MHRRQHAIHSMCAMCAFLILSPSTHTHTGFQYVAATADAATSVPAVCACTALLGFLRAWLHVPIALVLAEHLDAERFAAGNGLFMCVQGAIVFGVGAAVGGLQNRAAGSYAVTFHCLSAAMAACALPWLAELAWRAAAASSSSAAAVGVRRMVTVPPC